MSDSLIDDVLLIGWKAIARELGAESRTTAYRMYRESLKTDDPMPIIISGWKKVFRSDLRAWMKRQTEKPTRRQEITPPLSPS